MTRPMRLPAAAGAILLLLAASAGTALAHEERELDDLTLVVGFIDEPVFTGQKSGLEMSVTHAGAPVEGAEATLNAEVTYGDQTRELELAPRFGEPGWYESVFFPTAAGAYSFHIFGEVDGEPLDETFTSSPEGFSEVQEVAAGRFPATDVGGDAEAADGGLATLAVALGAAALLVSLVALGLAFARRRA